MPVREAGHRPQPRRRARVLSVTSTRAFVAPENAMDPDRPAYAQAMEMFPKLTEKQRSALCSVAFGGYGLGHSSVTLESLERRGLIEGVDVPLPGWPPVTIRAYIMEAPGPIHMAWCKWLSENYPDAEG